MKNTTWKTAFAVLMVMLCMACGKPSEPAEAPTEGEADVARPVTAVSAARGSIDHVIEADAVLYPVNQSNVTSKLTAPVKRVLVNRGDPVRTGQLLVELESADLAAAVEENRQQQAQAEAAFQLTGATAAEDSAKAQADVQAARQAMDTAQKVYESRTGLVKEGALAQRSADEAKVTLVQAQSQWQNAQRHLETLNSVGQRESVKSAQAQINAAKARVDNASVQLSYARVLSPIAGVVSDRPVYPGEMAASGAALISIVDISEVVARANVPVSEASAIQVGRPAHVNAGSADLTGRVTVVSPSVDPSTTTVEVWVQVANPGNSLKPGQAVHVSIVAGTIPNAIIVPASALLNGEGQHQKVIVVEDGTAHAREVKVGVRRGDRVQILDGIKAGDQVVTSGGLGLDDGAKVTVNGEAEKDDADSEKAEDHKDDDKNKASK